MASRSDPYISRGRLGAPYRTTGARRAAARIFSTVS